MKNNLPVLKGHVQPALHRGEIIAAFWRLEGCASELAIQNFDSIFRFHHFQEFLEIIGRDLVSEAAAAAVEHHHDLIRNCDSKFCCELRFPYVFRPRDLDRSEEHTSELQSQSNLVCRLLLEKKKKKNNHIE